MGKISYAIMNMDTPAREEIPISAKTDLGARRQAKKLAKEENINNYQIIFYRSSDGCRGAIDA